MHEAGKPPRQSGNFWKRFIVFSAIIIVGGGFLFYKFNFPDSFEATAVLVRDTLGEVLGSGNERNLAAEIDFAPTSENNAPSSPIFEPAILAAFVPESATALSQPIPAREPSSPVGGSLIAANESAHIVIAAVQIAGAASSNDFIKIFNPEAVAIDISGWKLRKRTNTGIEHSLRVLPAGSVIQPQGYFIWANSANGFAVSIGADVSSAETLAAGNSIAIEDSKNEVVDALAWGTGTNQFVEGAPYVTNPTAHQVLVRKISRGTAQDTDNNVADFEVR